MAHVKVIRSGGEPLFGQPVRSQTLQPMESSGEELAERLNDRLREKYRNYERAAVRLELRGEMDAAALLRRAASRARLLRNAPAAAPAEQTAAAE